MRHTTKHPVTVQLPFDDHRAMANHWGAEAKWAIAKALQRPPFVTEDLDLDHARATRMAAWHAQKVLHTRRESDR